MHTLYKTRSSYYLQKWVETVEVIQLQTRREMEAIGGIGQYLEDNQLVAIHSIRDLDEYLVDVNNGMDREE